MLEGLFRVRWPDESVHRCYSPSTVVEDHFSAGSSHSAAEFTTKGARVVVEGFER